MKKHFSVPSQQPPMYVAGGGGVRVSVGGPASAAVQFPSPQMTKMTIMPPTPPVLTPPCVEQQQQQPHTMKKAQLTIKTTVRIGAEDAKSSVADSTTLVGPLPPQPSGKNITINRPSAYAPAHHRPKKSSTCPTYTNNNNNNNSNTPAYNHQQTHIEQHTSTEGPTKATADANLIRSNNSNARPSPNLPRTSIVPPVPATGAVVVPLAASKTNNKNNISNNTNTPTTGSSSNKAAASVVVPFVVPAVTSASTVTVTKPSHQVLLIKPLPAFLTEDSGLLALAKSFVVGPQQQQQQQRQHINYLPYAAKVVRNTVLSAVTAAQLTTAKSTTTTTPVDEIDGNTTVQNSSKVDAILQAAIDQQEAANAKEQQQLMSSRQCFCEEGYGFLLFATEDAGLTYLRAVHAAAAASANVNKSATKISAPARLSHGMRPHAVNAVRKDFDEIKSIQNKLYADHTNETIAAAAATSTPPLAHHLIHLNNSNNKAVPPATRLTAAALHQQGKQLAAAAAASSTSAGSSHGPTASENGLATTTMASTSVAVEDGLVGINEASTPMSATHQQNVGADAHKGSNHGNMPPPLLRSVSYTSSVSSSSCDSATSFDSNSTIDTESCADSDVAVRADDSNRQRAHKGGKANKGTTMNGKKVRTASATSSTAAAHSSASCTGDDEQSSSACVHCTHHRRLYRIYYKAKMNKLLERAHVPCSVVAAAAADEGEAAFAKVDGNVGASACGHRVLSNTTVADTPTPHAPSSLAAHIESMRALFSNCFFNTTISPAGVDGTVSARPKAKTLALKGCAFGNKTRVGRGSAAAALAAPAPARATTNAGVADTAAEHDCCDEGHAPSDAASVTAAVCMSRAPSVSVSVGGKPQPPMSVIGVSAPPPISPAAAASAPTSSSYVHLPSSSVEATAAMAKGISKLIPALPQQAPPRQSPSTNAPTTATASSETVATCKISSPLSTAALADELKTADDTCIDEEKKAVATAASATAAAPPRCVPQQQSASIANAATTAARFAEAVAASPLFTSSVMTIQKPIIIETVRRTNKEQCQSVVVESENKTDTDTNNEATNAKQTTPIGPTTSLTAPTGDDGKNDEDEVYFEVSYGQTANTATVYNFNEAFDQAMAMLIKRNVATSANTTAYKAEAALPLATRHHTHHRHCVIHRQQASNRRSERRRQKNLVAKIASRVQHTPHIVAVPISLPLQQSTVGSSAAAATIQTIVVSSSPVPATTTVKVGGPISVVVGGPIASVVGPKNVLPPPAYGTPTSNVGSEVLPSAHSHNHHVNARQPPQTQTDYSNTYALEELIVASDEAKRTTVSSATAADYATTIAPTTATTAIIKQQQQQNVNASNPFLCSIYATPANGLQEASEQHDNNNNNAYNNVSAVASYYNDYSTHCNQAYHDRQHYPTAEEEVSQQQHIRVSSAYSSSAAATVTTRCSASSSLVRGSSIIIIPNAASAMTPTTSSRVTLSSSSSASSSTSSTPDSHAKKNNDNKEDGGEKKKATSSSSAASSSSNKTDESFIIRRHSATNNNTNTNSSSLSAFSSSSASSSNKEGEEGATSSSSIGASSASIATSTATRYRYNPYGDRGLEAFNTATESNKQYYSAAAAALHQQQQQQPASCVDGSENAAAFAACNSISNQQQHAAAAASTEEGSSSFVAAAVVAVEDQKVKKRKEKKEKREANNGDQPNNNGVPSTKEKKSSRSSGQKRSKAGENHNEETNLEKRNVSHMSGNEPMTADENAHHQTQASSASYYTSLASYIPSFFGSSSTAATKANSSLAVDLNEVNNSNNNKAAPITAMATGDAVAAVGVSGHSQGGQAAAAGIAAGAARLIGGVGLKDVASDASTTIRNMLAFSKVKRF